MRPTLEELLRRHPFYIPNYREDLETICLQAIVASSWLVLSCGSSVGAQDIPGFEYDGEQNWTYDDGSLQMKGILVKPEGDGPFPAILLSHGKNGSALGFGLNHAKKYFVPMVFVCIAPNYTHAAGETGPPGASAENVARGLKCLEIVRSFPYVNRRRVAAYGHSMGAFVEPILAALQESDGRGDRRHRTRTTCRPSPHEVEPVT